MTYLSAFDLVRERWGEEVAKEVLMTDKYPMTMEQFLSQHCIACGGDLGKLLLSGVQKLWSRVYDAIPNHMGVNCFETIINLLFCLGVWIPEDA